MHVILEFRRTFFCSVILTFSLVHHYQIHKLGLPHIAFRKDYVARLRALLPPAVAQSREGMLSPVSSGPVSLCHARSAELELESPRKTRRVRRRTRPVRVMGESVGDLPILSIQDPSNLQGTIVYNCLPPLLPVSLQLEDIGPLPLRPTVVSANLAAPPREDGMAVSGVSQEGVAIPELGVAPLADSETDLEDELPTPDGSPSVSASGPEGVCLTGVRPAFPDVLECRSSHTWNAGVREGASRCVHTACDGNTACGPCGGFTGGSVFVSGAFFFCVAERRPIPYIRISPLREVADSPILDVFPPYLVSSAGSVYEPVTSPLTPSLQEDDAYRPPRWTSTCREMVICFWGIRRTGPFWRCR